MQLVEHGLGEDHSSLCLVRSAAASVQYSATADAFSEWVYFRYPPAYVPAVPEPSGRSANHPPCPGASSWWLLGRRDLETLNSS